MVNDKNHLHTNADLQKESKFDAKVKTQQQFSQFSLANKTALTGNQEYPPPTALQIATKPQIGGVINDTLGSIGATTQIIFFDIYGSEYTTMEITGDVIFAFEKLPQGRHIQFTLDWVINTDTPPKITLPDSIINLPTLPPMANKLRVVLHFDGVKDDTSERYTFIGGTTTTAGGLSEPIILGINVITPVTAPTLTPIAWNTKNPQYVTVNRNIKFSFTNLPPSGSYQGILVILDVDNTGGYASPVWPSSVTNPPVIPTAKNQRTSVMLYTINGGTTVTHATSVGSSSGGGGGGDVSKWSTYDATSDIDFNTHDATNIDRLRFVTNAKTPVSNADPSIWLDAGGYLNFNVKATDGLRFKSNNEEIALLTDGSTTVKGGLYMRQYNDIRLDGNNLFFDTTDKIHIGQSSTNALTFHVNNEILMTLTHLSVIPAKDISFQNALSAKLLMDGKAIVMDDDEDTSIVSAYDDYIAFNTGANLRLSISNIAILASVDITMASGKKLTNLSPPTSDKDAATKKYVDDNAGSGGGANTTLSNLTTLNINQDLLPNQTSGGNIGSATTGKDWFNLFVRRLTFSAATTITSTDYGVGRVSTPNRIVYNVPSAAIHRWSVNGVTEMDLSNTKLILKGVNLDLENNDITDIDRIYMHGPSGATAHAYFSVTSTALNIVQNGNGGQTKFFAKNSGGTQSQVFTVDGNAPQVIVGSGNVGLLSFGLTGNQASIYRLSDELNIAAKTSTYLRINGGIVASITATDLLLYANKFLSFSDNTTLATGGFGTLPSRPVGFIKVKVLGSERRVPFYNP